MAASPTCTSSKIYNANKLYCDYVACCSATIYGVSNVYSTAYQAMTGAVIDSDYKNIEVVLAAFDSGYLLSIYCYGGDSCKVKCLTHGACSSTTVYQCHDNAIVVCDESNGKTGKDRSKDDLP